MSCKNTSPVLLHKNCSSIVHVLHMHITCILGSILSLVHPSLRVSVARKTMHGRMFVYIQNVYTCICIVNERGVLLLV